MTTDSIIALAVFIAANVAAAASGAVFKPDSWFRDLRKPSWQPPDWLFAPVWSLLYLMIAVSGWLVWREAGLAGAAVPLAIYGVQLVLNFLWSALFFGAHRIDWALGEVVLLWLSIAATIAAFAPISALAAWLLAPYLAWVTFAAALNATILRLNPRPA